MYLHKTKNGHYTPPCCYFSGELEVVECLPQTFSCGMMVWHLRQGQLYTWTPTYSEELGCPGEEEHYHGTDYCKQVIADVFATMNWGTQKYLGSLDRIANEVFNVNSTEGIG